MSEKLLTCDNLSVKCHDQWLFRNISVTMHAGEVWHVHGPSGAGKSILLQILERGSLSDSPLVSMQGEATAARNSIFIPAEYHFDANTTVGEQIVQWERQSAQPEISQAVIHFFELEPYLESLAVNLSTGIGKRLQLAQLFYAQESIWLLDHPSALLDASGQHMLEGLMSGRREQRGLIVYTSPTETLPENDDDEPAPDFLRHLDLAKFTVG